MITMRTNSRDAAKIAESFGDWYAYLCKESLNEVSTYGVEALKEYFTYWRNIIRQNHRIKSPK